MNKFIPLMLGLALMSGSVAMAAPASSTTKVNHKAVAIKKHTVKKSTSLKKPAGKTVISKK